jgi:hypothetical protein
MTPRGQPSRSPMRRHSLVVAARVLPPLVLCVATLVGPSGASYGEQSNNKYLCAELMHHPGQPQHAGCHTQVVVIGAGAAGLATARALQDLWEEHVQCDCTKVANTNVAPATIQVRLPPCALC